MNPTIRKALESDLNFIRSSWLISYWSTYAKRHLEYSIYRLGQKQRMERLLSESQTLIAYFPEVPDEILGWACREGRILHYCYVKAAYRRKGIGLGLAGGELSLYSHQTNSQGGLFLKKANLEFNPYTLENL